MKRPPRIAIIGSINVDLTTFVDELPNAGETIFAPQFQLGFGGKGANQAVAAKLCGAEVTMLARVGEDLFGPAAIENLRKHGIDTTYVLKTPGVSTGVAPIFVDRSGQNRILVVKGANDRLLPADIDAAADMLARADTIILQLEIPLETVYSALEFGARRGIRTILNPAPAQPLNRRKIASADYLIPNETEAAALAGSAGEPQSWAERLRDNGVRNVIVTLGENGALSANERGIQHFPPVGVSAVDTSGAGDAFIGSFASFLAGGDDEPAAISKANLYAALSTQKTGTQCSFVNAQQFEQERLLRAT